MNSASYLLIGLIVAILIIFLFSRCNNNEPYYYVNSENFDEDGAYVDGEDFDEDGAYSLPYVDGEITPGAYSLPFSGGKIIPEGTYADKDDIGNFQNKNEITPEYLQSITKTRTRILVKESNDNR